MTREVTFLIIFTFFGVAISRNEAGDKNVAHYTNLWTVWLSKNDDGVLEKLKMLDGFETIQQDHLPPGLHLIVHKNHPQRGKYRNSNLTNIIMKYDGILWAEQVSVKRIQEKLVIIECPGKSSFGTSRYKGLFNDKLFHKQWYLQDCRKNDNDIQFDLNVLLVWHHYKIFGRGIRVMVVDSGVQIDHPDLEVNYDPDYGIDFEKYPTPPTPKGFFKSSHGTNCAGIIAMRANNEICGVGIAPLVTFGAVRIMDNGKATDLAKAFGLLFRAEDVDISSNSWGPDDDGKLLESNDVVVVTALKAGITKGRRSKGVIYIFPSGNGKSKWDTCAHDSLASSMYTITVSGVKHNGNPVLYSERCSNVFVAAYSGDTESGLWGSIITTQLNGGCSKLFRGTSAAVPMVSGIVALILEANPNLSWREVQHVLAWTSQIAPLAHNKVWSRNKAGFYFSQDFGFGLVNAYNAVTFAMNMQPISPMNSCVLSIKTTKNMLFHRKSALRIEISTNGCSGLPSEVNYIEHVQLLVSVSHARRGAIQILLISPSGTRTLLMDGRQLDKSKLGLYQWALDTVHLWGEYPQGKWSIIFFDSISHSDFRGVVTEAILIIHGTKDKPPHYNDIRKYNRPTDTWIKSAHILD